MKSLKLVKESIISLQKQADSLSKGNPSRKELEKGVERLKSIKKRFELSTNEPDKDLN